MKFVAATSNIDPVFGYKSSAFALGDTYWSELGLISEEFRRWLPGEAFGRKVVCFYELSPTVHNEIVRWGAVLHVPYYLFIISNRSLQIVKKDSAVLPHCDAVGLSADHLAMAKFRTNSSADFNGVIQCMRSMYCLAEDNMRVLLRHSLGPDLHGRLRNLPITPDGCEEFIVSTRGSSESRNIGRLALILEDQGHFMKAEEKLRKAVGLLIASGQCGPEARTVGRFALAPEDHSRYKEIQDKLGEAVEDFEMQQSPGIDDVAMFFCLNKMASLLCQRGQFKDAENISRSCLSANIKISGKGSKPTLLSANNLALSLRHQGRNRDAYHLLWDALENANSNTSQNVVYVRLLDTLARLALECRGGNLAESLSCDVVRRSICLYGDKHPFTLTCMSNLAAILARAGRISGAEAISRLALNGLEQSLGTDHPYCLKAARRLADYIRLQQRYPDASLRLKQTLKMQEIRIGDDHPDTLSTLRSLGAVYALQGFLKNSELLLDQALKGQKQFFGLQDALAKVKELQKKRPSAEAKVQRELLELFGPRARATSDANHRRDDYMSSLFQKNSEEGLVFESVVCANKESLPSILVENRLDSSTLGRALREAAAASQELSVRQLLKCEAPIDANSAFHGTALQAASFSGSEAVVKLLLERSQGVNQKVGIFGNALRAAILGRHTAIIDLLLGNSLSEKVSLENLNSTMQVALLMGDVDLVSRLLEAGADINSIDNLFGSPLQQASLFGQQKIMAKLISCGAKIKMRGGVFGSPLQAAMQTQNLSAIAQLLEADANVRSARDKSGTFVFNESSPSSDAEAKLALESRVDSFRCTPLSSPVGSWKYSSLSQTVEHPAELPVPPVKPYHGTDDLGSTPSGPAKGTRLTAKAAIKRISTFKSRSGEDGSTKREYVKKRTKIKRYLPF